MYGRIKDEIYDDLKTNFRSWEQDCDNPIAAEKLAKIVCMRHPEASFDMCYRFACDWVGYEDEDYET